MRSPMKPRTTKKIRPLRAQSRPAKANPSLRSTSQSLAQGMSRNVARGASARSASHSRSTAPAVFAKFAIRTVRVADAAAARRIRAEMVPQASAAHSGAVLLLPPAVVALLLPPGMAASTPFGSQVLAAPEAGAAAVYRLSLLIPRSKRALFSLTCISKARLSSII